VMLNCNAFAQAVFPSPVFINTARPRGPYPKVLAVDDAPLDLTPYPDGSLVFSDSTLSGGSSAGNGCSYFYKSGQTTTGAGFALTKTGTATSGTGIGYAYSQYSPIGSISSVVDKSVNVHIEEGDGDDTIVDLEFGVGQNSSAPLASTVVAMDSVSINADSIKIISINLGQMLDTLVQDASYDAAEPVYLFLRVVTNSAFTDLDWLGVDGTHASVVFGGSSGKVIVLSGVAGVPATTKTTQNSDSYAASRTKPRRQNILVMLDLVGTPTLESGDFDVYSAQVHSTVGETALSDLTFPSAIDQEIIELEVSSQYSFKILTAAVSDSFSLAEFRDNQLGGIRNLVDALSLTDSVTKSKLYTEIESESVELAETLETEVLKRVRNLTESLTLSETVSTLKIKEQSITDLVILDELVDTVGSFGIRSIIDSLSLEEQVSVNRTFASLAIEDSLSFTESLVGLKGLVPDLPQDVLVLLEDLVTVKVLIRSLADSISFSDSVDSEIVLVSQQVIDTLQISEVWSAGKLLSYSIEDCLLLTDRINRIKTVNILDGLTLTDGLSLTDILDILSFTETIVTNAVSRKCLTGFQILHKSISDSLGFTDYVGPKKTGDPNLQDTLDLADSVIWWKA